MTDYTPTTLQIETCFLTSAGHFTHPGSRKEQFDRWLAEHDRQVAEAAFDEGADQVSSDVLFWHPQATGPYNPYRKDTNA